MKFPVLLCLLASPVLAQVPPAAQPPPEIAPSPSAAPAAPAGTPVNPPKPIPKATPKPVLPAPTPPATVDSLNAADVQKALDTLQADYISTLSEDQKARATLQGLLDRLAPAISLTFTTGSHGLAAPFYSELYQDRTGYLRPGDLSAQNLGQCEDALKMWSKRGIGAVILDLRATPPEHDFQKAARLSGLFCAKGAELFSMARMNNASPGEAPQTFRAEAEPLFKGVLVVLVDRDTAESAETVAAVLRRAAKALLVGDPTPGKAFEYNDVPLGSGLSLHLAVARAEFAGGTALSGLKPDISEGLGNSPKGALMDEITAHGVHSVVTEKSRGHLNEAALVAGSDPGIDALEAEQHPPATVQLIDRQLQRALDAVTSIALFQAKTEN